MIAAPIALEYGGKAAQGGRAAPATPEGGSLGDIPHAGLALHLRRSVAPIVVGGILDALGLYQIFDLIR